MPKIDYWSLAKKAGAIVMHNRYLLWFGLFVLAGQLSGTINFGGMTNDVGNSAIEKMGLSQELTILEFFFVLITAVGLVLVRLIGFLSILISIQNFQQGRKAGVRMSILVARSKLGDAFRIWLIANIFVTLIFLVLLLPASILLEQRATAMAWSTGIVGAAIFLPIMIGVFFVEKYSYFYLVFGKMTVKRSIECAYLIFKKKLAESMMFGLWLIAVSFMTIFAVGLSAGVVFLLAAIPGLILYFTLGTIGGAAFLSVAAVALGFIAIVLVSAFYAITGAMWVLFFDEIAGIKTPEAVEDKVTARDDLTAVEGA